MEFIKLGNTTFRTSTLRKLTQSEALKLFNHIDPRTVKEAHKRAKGKKTKAKK